VVDFKFSVIDGLVKMIWNVILYAGVMAI